MEHSFGTYANNLKDDISSYIDLRIKYAKLLVYEKISLVIAKSISFILLGFFAFFAFFFLSFTLGYYLGDLLNNVPLGFGIVTLFYLTLLFLVIILRKKYIEQIIIDKIIGSLMNEDNNKNEEEKE